jgi:hypothetical protein
MRIIGLLLVLFQAAGCFGQQQPGSGQDGSLKEFLQKYVGMPDAETKTTQYSAAFVDLRDNGTKEVIVYLSSDSWCGTGGCTMLILAPEGGSYKVVTKTPTVKLPIRILTTKSNGWHDIGVVGRINGVEPLYEAVLSFDGKTYPESLSDARPSQGEVQGKTVITQTAKDTLLYP